MCNLALWPILTIFYTYLLQNYDAKYHMGCDCGQREVTDADEKECKDSEMLDFNEEVAILTPFFYSWHL